jgi:ABC-type lipoprotein release transport system permease subunit
MIFTFLNLVVVSGILVGLIEGSVDANKKHNTGDIFITSFLNQDYISHSGEVIKVVETIPGLASYTARITGAGQVVADYRGTLLKGEKENAVGGLFVGIDPVAENEVTSISDIVKNGAYLTETDAGSLLLGRDLLYQYNPIEFPGFTALKNVEVGSKVMVRLGDSQKEFVVKGLLKGKVNETDSRVFMLKSELRKLKGDANPNYNEIAIDLLPGADTLSAKAALIASGVGEYARVQTSTEAQPKFLVDIKATFGILGNAISSIGLVVASITIFIVIFVNAITRRRYIGILKGIGITPRAISVSYMIQSVFYALAGSVIGMILVFAVLKPFFVSHPIDFPFSDGILVATLPGTFLRVGILLVATLVAGYIPARIVIRQNTLSAILGR